MKTMQNIIIISLSFIWGVIMDFDFLRSVSGSSAAFRVVCGEMVLDDRWNVHCEVTLATVRVGTMMIETTSGIYSLKQGDIYVIAPNQKYRLFDYNKAVVDVILLNLSNPASLTQEYIPQNLIRGLTTGNCTHFAKISPEDLFYADMIDAFRIVTKAENERFDFFQLLVHGKMYEIFYMLFANKYIEIYDVESQGKKYRALRRITEYINEHFCENISLETIANTTGLSRYYVSHLFKDLLNTTFVNYVNELRLSRAATLLTTTDTPVIEIAGLSGFNNISNFNRAFKMYFDTTPSKYRKVERQKF